VPAVEQIPTYGSVADPNNTGHHPSLTTQASTRRFNLAVGVREASIATSLRDDLNHQFDDLGSVLTSKFQKRAIECSPKLSLFIGVDLRVLEPRVRSFSISLANSSGFPLRRQWRQKNFLDLEHHCHVLPDNCSSFKASYLLYEDIVARNEI